MEPMRTSAEDSEGKYFVGTCSSTHGLFLILHKWRGGGATAQSLHNESQHVSKMPSISSVSIQAKPTSTTSPSQHHLSCTYNRIVHRSGITSRKIKTHTHKQCTRGEREHEHARTPPQPNVCGLARRIAVRGTKNEAPPRCASTKTAHTAKARHCPKRPVSRHGGGSTKKKAPGARSRVAQDLQQQQKRRRGGGPSPSVARAHRPKPRGDIKKRGGYFFLASCVLCVYPLYYLEIAASTLEAMSQVRGHRLGKVARRIVRCARLGCL